MDEWRDNITILQQIVRRRTRAYREWLVDDAGLRAALPDDQARRLLDWAERQIDQTARATLALPDVEAEERLDRTMQSVRRVLRRVNRLVEQWPADATAAARLDDERRADLIDLLRHMRVLTGATPSAAQLDLVEQFAARFPTLSPAERFDRLLELLQPPAAPSAEEIHE